MHCYCFVVSLVFYVYQFFFFFFKQKTAYEMRISDWSSDVCSSDLQQLFGNDESLQRAALVTAILARPGHAYPALPPQSLAEIRVRFGPTIRAGSNQPRIPLALDKIPHLLAQPGQFSRLIRTEERRAGQEWGRACRSRGRTETLKK